MAKNSNDFFQTSEFYFKLKSNIFEAKLRLINIKSLIQINQMSNFVKVLTKKRNDKNGVHKSQRFVKNHDIFVIDNLTSFLRLFTFKNLSHEVM